jgi:hypothetical protein
LVVGHPGTSGLIGIATSLVVAATLVLLILNPVFVVYAVVGFAFGWLLRYTLRRTRGHTGGAEPRRRRAWPLLALGATIAVAVVVAGGVWIVSSGEPGAVNPPPLQALALRAAGGTFSARYVAEASYAHDRFHMRERLIVPQHVVDEIAGAMTPVASEGLLARLRIDSALTGTLLRRNSVAELVRAEIPPDVLRAAGISRAELDRANAEIVTYKSAAARAERVASALIADGWQRPSRLNGSLVFIRRRPNIDAPVRLYPLNTPIRFRVPAIFVGPGPTSLVPDDRSFVDLLAPRSLIRSTDPAAEIVGDAGTFVRRRVSLDSEGGFPVDAIAIDANSPLARNPIVHRMQNLTLWTPLGYLLAILAAILSDEIKERVRRLLRLGPSGAGVATSAQTTS